MGELTESSFLEKLSEVGDLDWIQNAALLVLGGKASIGLIFSLVARAKTTSTNKSIEQSQQKQGGDKEEKGIQDEAIPILVRTKNIYTDFHLNLTFLNVSAWWGKKAETTWQRQQWRQRTDKEGEP